MLPSATFTEEEPVEKEIVLITVSGKDKPGVTEGISEILTRYSVHILDIGQAVIHDTLSLGFLVEVPEKAESSPVLRDVLYYTHGQKLEAHFEPISENDYELWVNEQGKQRHIVTILGNYVTAEHISQVSHIIVQQGLNIDKISRLSGRVSLSRREQEVQACIEFSVRGTPENASLMKARFLNLATQFDIDIAVQEDDIYRRNRRVVAFDMDSTLLTIEVIDELAKAAGVGQQVVSITEQAMRGELDFRGSFEQRLGLLKGLSESEIKKIADGLPLNQGAERLMKILKSLGYKTAIISGGFTYFANALKERLGFDYVFANQLEIVDGMATGRVIEPIVDAEMKAECLEEVAKLEGVQLAQVVAVGDGANDLKMLSKAGLGIAFRAKPIVKESARQSLSQSGLDGILYLMGIKQRELEMLDV